MDNAEKKRTPLTEEEKRERKNARQREYAKNTGYAAQDKYHKERGKNLALRLFTPQDDDIILYLETIENKAGYIKQLIRDDMKNRNKI